MNNLPVETKWNSSQTDGRIYRQARESTGNSSGQDAQKRSKPEKRLTWQDNGLSRQPRRQNKPSGKLCCYPQFTQTQSALWYTNCCPVCPQCQQTTVVCVSTGFTLLCIKLPQLTSRPLLQHAHAFSCQLFFHMLCSIVL